jgi:hypothetical protein
MKFFWSWQSDTTGEIREFMKKSGSAEPAESSFKRAGRLRQPGTRRAKRSPISIRRRSTTFPTTKESIRGFLRVRRRSGLHQR